MERSIHNSTTTGVRLITKVNLQLYFSAAAREMKQDLKKILEEMTKSTISNAEVAHKLSTKLGEWHSLFVLDTVITWDVITVPRRI